MRGEPTPERRDVYLIEVGGPNHWRTHDWRDDRREAEQMAASLTRDGCTARVRVTQRPGGWARP